MESNRQTQATYLKAVSQWLEKINEISNSNLLNSATNEDLKAELNAFFQQNSKLSNDLTNYKSSLNNLIECDDLECDLFFDDKQHSFKDQVKEHIKQYKKFIERI